jgi:hypothetical protein
MELLEIKNAGGAADASSREHLERCDRCQALLAHLTSAEPVDVEVPERLPRLLAARTELPRPEHTAAGQLWLAVARTAGDWTYPVVVIGRPRKRPGTVLVVPLMNEVDEATDLDVVLGSEPLGYSAAAAVWAYGAILEQQLAEYVADLDSALLAEIRDLYQHVASTAERPAASHTGPALAGGADPRRRFRQELLDRLRPLYEPVRSAEVERSTFEPSIGEEAPSFGALLASILAGREWDRQVFLERANLSAELLDSMLGDWLDLTHGRDIEAVARTLKTLDLDAAEVEAPIFRSLHHSRGGEQRAESGELSVAARASTGASAEDLERELYRGLESIDESPAARERAAAAYWRALLDELEEA